MHQQLQKLTEQVGNLKTTEINLTKGNKRLFLLQNIDIKNVV